MTKNIKWDKVDRTIKRKTVMFNGVYNLDSVIWYGVCPYCGEKIEWEYWPDADGSNYTGECHCEDMEGYHYYATVVALDVNLYKDEEEDEE